MLLIVGAVGFVAWKNFPSDKQPDRDRLDRVYDQMATAPEY